MTAMEFSLPRLLKKKKQNRYVPGYPLKVKLTEGNIIFSKPQRSRRYEKIVFFFFFFNNRVIAVERNV